MSDLNRENADKSLDKDANSDKDAIDRNKANITSTSSAPSAAAPEISVPVAAEFTCSGCGRRFILRAYEREWFARRGLEEPKRCQACRKAARKLRKEEEEQRENEVRKARQAEEKKRFVKRIKGWNVVAREDIRPADDHVLYIIGNGFDLMHCVRSSYYAFRDSLGKQSKLRQALENFVIAEDIWADFEDALARFDIKSMGSSFMVDNWLDLLGAYEEDAGMAEFSMAAEAAANPILTVAEELPRRFRKWVETLAVGTADRPLQGMFRDGKVLCFNYTEFVETLYHVSKDHVCYIHGCRRKEKNHPKENLILGHIPGAGDENFDFQDTAPVEKRSSSQRELIEAAQDAVFRLIDEGDEALTKDCDRIIAAHESFFSELREIKEVIVIGHSLSSVDRKYFSEVIARNSDAKNIRWYFGCFGMRDLDNLERLLGELGLDRSAVSVFRTDNIAAVPSAKRKPAAPVSKKPVEKLRGVSPDGRWEVRSVEGALRIAGRADHKTDYEVLFSSFISDAFFTPSGTYLFAVVWGAYPGVFLFRLADKHWKFVNELEISSDHNILNRRLNHVFLTDTEIIFVYNNRVRKNSLEDGKLVFNQGVRDAGYHFYEGEDISGLFLKKR